MIAIKSLFTLKTIIIFALVLVVAFIWATQKRAVVPSLTQVVDPSTLSQDSGKTDSLVSGSEQIERQENNRKLNGMEKDTRDTESSLSTEALKYSEESASIRDSYPNEVMPAEEMIQHITDIANYTENDLWSFSDLGKFYERFLKLSTNSTSQQPVDSPPDLGEIIFTESDVWKKGQDQSGVVFDSNTIKIFALLPEGGGIREEVLVRWYEINNPELILFQKYTTPSNIARNHIWLEYPQGWAAGTYKVEIYSEDEFVDLLAQGQFEVVNQVE